jgi:hypothetical protein
MHQSRVAVNARHPEQVYFCTRRGQVFGTRDAGATWTEHRLPESVLNVISVACTSYRGRAASRGVIAPAPGLSALPLPERVRGRQVWGRGYARRNTR